MQHRAAVVTAANGQAMLATAIAGQEQQLGHRQDTKIGATRDQKKPA
ncbi:MAG: hypothetical protein J2P48_04280 [Alphaproteobacteria bacterium]|nr:hypothetical protein [Alphaproteobacteria bacterium]